MAIHKQQTEPLFADVIWAQPERADGRNRVLIVGGHSHALQAPLDAFRLLRERKLGAGVVLPDALRSLLKFGRPAAWPGLARRRFWQRPRPMTACSSSAT